MSVLSPYVSTFDWYEQEASRTVGDASLATLGLGLGGEAGEVQELLKKHLGHGHPLDKERLAKELGDVLWYLAMLATANGMHLQEIAWANIKKLRARYPDGFTPEASINRTE